MIFGSILLKVLKFFLIIFDVSQLDKIPELVQEIYTQNEAIDVLVNNAGVGLASDTPYSDEIFDKTFQKYIKLWK